jgi:uncharacterized membrane protein
MLSFTVHDVFKIARFTDALCIYPTLLTNRHVIIRFIYFHAHIDCIYCHFITQSTDVLQTALCLRKSKFVRLHTYTHTQKVCGDGCIPSCLRATGWALGWLSVLRSILSNPEDGASSGQWTFHLDPENFISPRQILYKPVPLIMYLKAHTVSYLPVCLWLHCLFA